VRLSRVSECPGGFPCWELTGTWLHAHADWNTDIPYGMSLSVHAGPVAVPVQAGDWAAVSRAPGFLLDLNAPHDEPNRLYLFAGRWHVILGLPSVRGFRETEDGLERVTRWLRPHIDGCSRYRYHQADGKWVQNEKPEPWHWGWLTITRRTT
jgi:hypothetical protein